MKTKNYQSPQAELFEIELASRIMDTSTPVSSTEEMNEVNTWAGKDAWVM